MSLLLVSIVFFQCLKVEEKTDNSSSQFIYPRLKISPGRNRSGNARTQPSTAVGSHSRHKLSGQSIFSTKVRVSLTPLL
ncbi:hypothetical protein Nepgr_016854 [Nepenthes gracilis]|uniref:Secreted protein n=1 Tax=Nepenthes gracilis TaxID=150966 RepID=A0AAD3XRZ2_NEPGR|nr:hypothetical protein Nepgr_016854 [Nepenthes gracilis]